jgi:hypothetical protein
MLWQKKKHNWKVLPSFQIASGFDFLEEKVK